MDGGFPWLVGVGDQALEQEVAVRHPIESGPNQVDLVCSLCGKVFRRILAEEFGVQRLLAAVDNLCTRWGIRICVPSDAPIENLWHYLKSHHRSNRVYDALEEVAMTAWQKSALNTEHMKAVCAARDLKTR